MAAFDDVCRTAADNADVADFLVVYIVEAHATDVWPLPGNVSISEHRSLRDRLAAAAQLRSRVVASFLSLFLARDVSVRLSVTEVHWRIIANLGFKFRSQFTAHCGRGECWREGRDHRREEWKDHLALCEQLLGPLV